MANGISGVILAGGSNKRFGGITKANTLKASAEDAIFVFAGEMTFLNPEIISDQINEFNKREHDVFIPKVDQLIEPLHAIYRKSALNHLERFLLELQKQP